MAACNTEIDHVHVLTEQDMDAQDDIFKSIEAYKDMTIEALQYSKIGKGE